MKVLQTGFELATHRPEAERLNIAQPIRRSAHEMKLVDEIRCGRLQQHV